MTLSFHRIAERELLEAAQYYEFESPGLGDAFLNEIERSCGLIVDNPQCGPLLSGAVRRKLVRRFPYALLYSVQADSLRILAVMNLKRRPNYWVGRR